MLVTYEEQDFALHLYGLYTRVNRNVRNSDNEKFDPVIKDTR